MLDEYGLTPKQRKFADLAIETGVGTTAALQAYDTDDYNSAHVISSQNLRKVTIINYIKQQCAAAGLSTPLVLLRLREELDAERKLISPTGEDLGSVPDFAARHRAIEASIKYVLPEFVELHRQGGSSSGGSRHLHLHGSSAAEIRGALVGKSEDQGDQ